MFVVVVCVHVSTKLDVKNIDTTLQVCIHILEFHRSVVCVHHLGPSLSSLAREYEKYFDGCVDDPEDQGEADSVSHVPAQEECNDRHKVKTSVTSSLGTTDDSGIDTPSYGRKVSWFSADLSKSHISEEQSPLPSPGAQPCQLGGCNSHSAPSSMPAQRPNQRRLSLGITSSRLDPDVECDKGSFNWCGSHKNTLRGCLVTLTLLWLNIASKVHCGNHSSHTVVRSKAVQRSVSFSEVYVERGVCSNIRVQAYLCGNRTVQLIIFGS